MESKLRKEFYKNFFKSDSRYLLIEATSGSGKSFEAELIKEAHKEVFPCGYDYDRYQNIYDEVDAFKYRSYLRDPSNQGDYYRENDDEPFPFVYISSLEKLGDVLTNNFKKDFAYPDKGIYDYKLIVAANKEEIQKFELDKIEHVSFSLDLPTVDELKKELSKRKIDEQYILNNEKYLSKFTYKLLDVIDFYQNNVLPIPELKEKSEDKLLIDTLYIDEELSKEQISRLLALIILGSGRVSEYDFDKDEFKLIFADVGPISKKEVISYLRNHDTILSSYLDQEDVPYLSRMIWFKHFGVYKLLLNDYLADEIKKTAKRYYMATELDNYILDIESIFAELRLKSIFVAYDANHLFNRLMNLDDTYLLRKNMTFRGADYSDQDMPIRVTHIDGDTFKRVFEEYIDELTFKNNSHDYLLNTFSALALLSSYNSYHYFKMLSFTANEFIPTLESAGKLALAHSMAFDTYTYADENDFFMLAGNYEDVPEEAFNNYYKIIDRLDKDDKNGVYQDRARAKLFANYSAYLNHTSKYNKKNFYRLVFENIQKDPLEMDHYIKYYLTFNSEEEKDHCYYNYIDVRDMLLFKKYAVVKKS